MSPSRRAAALVLFSVLALPGFPRSGESARPLVAPTALRPAAFDYVRRLDVNQLLMWVNNDGTFAWDYSSGEPGLGFPRSQASSVVYASGLWLSGVRGGVDTLVTGVQYSTDFGPGAMVDLSTWDDAFDPVNVVYKVVRWSGDPQDSAHVERSLFELASNPSLDPLAHHSWSEYMAGAATKGAPWQLYHLPDTSTPDPTDSVFVPGPVVYGDQMLWAVFNDADPVLHQTFGFGTPIGAEVRLAVFGFAGEDSLANTAFLRFEVIHKGTDPIQSSFLSLWVDPDVGDTYDDLVGCDTLSGLGYAYNGPNTDPVFGSAAPAVGYHFFQGAREGGNPLGLYSFSAFLNGQDPTTVLEAYRVASGLETSGDPLVNPITGLPTRYFGPGDPVAGTGWRDAFDLDNPFIVGFYLNDNTTHANGLAGVDFGGRSFGGGADAGWEFQEITGTRVSSINPYTQSDSFPQFLQLEFNGTQKAYRYLRREKGDGTAPAAGRGYAYGGFRDVPFVARDLSTLQTYDVAFVERVVTDDAGNPLPSGQQPATYDSTWSPDTSATGGYEYLLVLNRPYTGSPDPAFARDGVFDDTTRTARPPVLYALSSRQPDLASVRDPEDRFLFVFFLYFSDRRMLLSSGPFTFAPGDTQTVLAGITVGQGDSHLSSITDLRARDSFAQTFVNQGKAFLPPPTPVRDTLFTDRTDFGTNSVPTGVAAGDLDHDGKLDLAVISGFVDSLWVYYGKGGGSFEPPVAIAAGPNVHGVAIGELDGNLFPEIVTSNDGNQTVSVFEGSSTRFQASTVRGLAPPVPLRTDFGTASGPGAIAIGNVDGDAAPDVAVVCVTAESLTVLRGSTGGLTPDRADFGTGSAGTDVAAGDVNGDGLLDLVLTRKAANTISLFRGTPGGLDPARADFGTGSAPTGVALGDLNGDGKDDVVVTLLGTSDIGIHLGTAAGVSPDRTDFGTGSAPVRVALGDLNGDLRLDVATCNYDGNTITVLHGRGDGTLADRTEYPTGVAPGGLVLGDFNNDGSPDLLTVNVGSSSATLYSNQDQTVPTLISLASAEAKDGRVRLSWYAPHGGGTFAGVYRRESTSAWLRVGAVVADGYGRMEFTDDDVRTGATYAYRLGVDGPRGETFAGEVWVTVGPAPPLALAALANPTHGTPAFAFTLPRAGAASLELYDVRGRRVWSREVGGLGPGSPVLRVDDRTFSSGVYWARLGLGSESVLARFVHLR